MSNSNYRKSTISLIVVLFLFFAGANAVCAQDTAFTYQGKLSDTGAPANGTFDLQFKLFDNATVGTGTQQGSTVTLPTVQVASGIFTVQLDFGAAVFNGPDRFVEVGVRPAGSANPYTILGPRQKVTPTPYSIRSNSAATADNAVTAVNATQLGGIAPSGFLRNATTQQSGANFNISGNGTVGGTLTGVSVSAENYLLSLGSIATKMGMTWGGVSTMSIAPNGDLDVGIGTRAPVYRLEVLDQSNRGLRVGTLTSHGTVASFGGLGDFLIDLNGIPGGRLTVNEGGNVGIGTNSPTSKLHVIGNAIITGNLTKGGGSFKIDHPLDPENKYLYHSFVESPDMLNIYNGVVRLNRRGEAFVAMPEWFEALNRDFRYQLTCVGRFAPVFVAREIKGNRFKIAGGKPGMRVSWQVTGVRHDAYANKNRIPVEEEKPASERGSYLHPDAFPNAAPAGHSASSALARENQ